MYDLTDFIIHETSTRNKYRKGYKKGYKDGYANAIEEFAEAMKMKYPICTNDFGMVINESAHKTIDEIAKELKGE